MRRHPIIAVTSVHNESKRVTRSSKFKQTTAVATSRRKPRVRAIVEEANCRKIIWKPRFIEFHVCSWVNRNGHRRVWT